jgi:hypothetical protein
MYPRVLPNAKSVYLFSATDVGVSFYVWARRDKSGYAVYAQAYIKGRKTRRTLYLGFFKSLHRGYLAARRAFSLLLNKRIVPHLMGVLEKLAKGSGKTLGELMIDLLDNKFNYNNIREALKYISLAKSGSDRERRRVKYVLNGRIRKLVRTSGDAVSLSRLLRLVFASAAFSRRGERAHESTPNKVLKAMHESIKRSALKLVEQYRRISSMSPSAGPYVYEMMLFALDALYDVDRSVAGAMGRAIKHAVADAGVDGVKYVDVRLVFEDKPGPGEKGPRVQLTRKPYVRLLSTPPPTSADRSDTAVAELKGGATGGGAMEEYPEDEELFDV